MDNQQHSLNPEMKNAQIPCGCSDRNKDEHIGNCDLGYEDARSGSDCCQGKGHHHAVNHPAMRSSSDQVNNESTQPACGCGHSHEEAHHCVCDHQHEETHNCGCDHDHELVHHDGCGHHYELDHHCSCGHSHEEGSYCGCQSEHHWHGEEDLGLSLIFEGEFDQEVAVVWQYLTEETTLKRWNPEVQRFDKLAGGTLHVKQEGIEQALMITDVIEEELLSFQWGNDQLVLSLGAQTDSTSSFSFEFWFADKETASAERVVPWLAYLYQLDHFINEEELLNDNYLKTNLTEEIKTLIQDQQTRELG